MKFVRILAFLVASCAFVLTVWWIGLGQSLSQLEQRGRSDLALASDRLIKQLSRYSELAVVLAGDPQWRATDTDPVELQRLLLRPADLSGALDLVLIGANRQPIASASGLPPDAWLEESFVDRALTGALGKFHGISQTFATRAFYFAAPIFKDDGLFLAPSLRLSTWIALKPRGGGRFRLFCLRTR